MLRIRNWEANFETHESRKLKRLAWLSIPNDLLDLCYRMLIAHPNGASHFAVWIVILQIGSMCRIRGTLSEGGMSLTAQHLAMKSGLAVAVFEEAIPRLLQIGWLEELPDTPGPLTGIAGNSPGVAADIPATLPPSREVAVETSAYITETLHNSIDKTLCSSGDERSAGIVLELTPPQAAKPTDEILRWFDLEFWPMYPRKVGKPQALKAARRHANTATDRAAILECLKRRLPSIQAQFRTDGDFRQYPASWLHQMPWTEPEEVATPIPAARNNQDVLDHELDRILAEKEASKS